MSMPITGGKCRKLWKLTAVAMVAINKNIMRFAPRFMTTVSVSQGGCSLGTAKCIMAAGTTQFTSDGKNSEKKLTEPLIILPLLTIKQDGLSEREG